MAANLDIAPSTLPAIDVVILTWNDGPLLEAAIASVDASVGVTTRVVVVDNGSTPPATVPGHVDLVRSPKNLGVAAGRNRGIAKGCAPFVLLLDSDAALRPRALHDLAATLAADPTIAMTVPVFVDQQPEESAGAAPTLRRKIDRVRNKTTSYGSIERHPDAEQWDVDFGIGACQLFTREAWEMVGGIDESFFYGPEDADFCMRIGDAGGRIVQVRGAAVDHPPRRRFRGLATKRGIAHAWAVCRFLWRHRGRTAIESAPQALAGAEARAEAA